MSSTKAYFAVKVGLVLLGLPIAPLAAAPGANQAAPQNSLADAMELAALLDPGPLLADVNVRLFRRRMETAVEQDTSFRRFVTANPAIFASAQSAGEQAMRAKVLSLYPDQQRAKADLYARELTPDDLRVLLAYYRSPLGVKVVAAGFAAMNGNTEADRVAARGSAMAQLSDVERGQVVALASTIAAQHLHSAYAERQAISREWAIKNQAVISAAATTALTEVLGSLSSPKTSSPGISR